MEVEELLQLKHDQRLIVDYVYIAFAVILVYDHVCTIEMEVALIWRSSWTYTKVLFLVTRYLPIPSIFNLLYNQFSVGLSSSTCSLTVQLFNGLGMFSIMCAEGIFMVRTWAVWNRNRRLGFMLFGFACLMFCICVVELSYTAHQTASTPSPSIPDLRGCYRPLHFSSIVDTSFFWLCFVDCVMLGLMVASAFKTYKYGDNSKLVNVIHRDGVLFYVYILFLVLLDAIFLLTSPPTLVNLFYPVPTACYSILSARVILNIRSVAWEERSTDMEIHTELHTKNECSENVHGLPLMVVQ